MVGLDTNWIYTTTREVEFTTLPAGPYTFVLNVMNSDETWSNHVMNVHLTICKPFWKKWWFILGCILLSAYSMFYLIKYRLKRVQLREEKITDLNKTLMSLKLKVLRAQMNPHFTFNVMNSIHHFIAIKDEETTNRYLSRFSKLIRLILDNSVKHGVQCTIEDNGIGRSKSYFVNKSSTHKSFGTAITQECLTAINALNKINLSENVIELEVENGNALGTRVEIYIPFI